MKLRLREMRLCGLVVLVVNVNDGRRVLLH